jgi:TRAP-type C4-dicarboxylate transport system permease small subunit
MLVLNILKGLSSFFEKVVKISIIVSMGGIVFFVNVAVFYRYVLDDPLTWTNEISSYLLVFFVNVAVFYRYVLDDPLTWTNEISSYLLVFSVLFGASIALRHWFVTVGTQLLIAAFLVICIDSPSMLIQKAILTKTISPALGIPMVHLYHLLRVGFICMLFFVSISTIEFIFTRGTKAGNGEGSK